MTEVTFASERSYPHPYEDVRVVCELTSPSGRTQLHDAFWDGAMVWRVRFLPQEAGLWTYTTVASDTTNAGLHGRRGSVKVDPYEGDDRWRVKGPPRVDTTLGVLTYGNGEPLFYIGDTAWEISWRSTSGEVRRYVSDRRAKGFNGTQIVMGSHLFLPDAGVSNRRGERLYLHDDFSRPNPNFFRYLDTVVSTCNDSGLIVGIVPVWSNLTELYSDQGFHRRPLTRREHEIMARYVAARYGGYNVFWIVGADALYDTEERREHFSRVAEIVTEASGGSHLRTIHTGGWTTSWYFFDDSTSWLDFHTYQPGHDIGTRFAWEPLTSSKARALRKPILSAESVYEDINHGIKEGTPRVEPWAVRRAMLEALLAGAEVGYIYGANGVWQWAQPDGLYPIWPRLPVMDAMQLPASAQISRIATLLRAVGWPGLEPAPERLADLKPDDGEMHVSIASIDSTVIAYLPRGLEEVTLDLSGLGPQVQLQWVDPAEGRPVWSERVTFDDGEPAERTFSPDSARDWVLLATSGRRLVSGAPLSRVPGRDLECRIVSREGGGVLRVSMPERGDLLVDLVDVTGRVLTRLERNNVAGEVDVTLPEGRGVWLLARVMAVMPNGPSTVTLPVPVTW